MKHSQSAIDLIKKSRKLLTVASPLWNGYLYIGYGHRLRLNDGVDIEDKLSKKKATELLEKDLKLVSKQILKYLTRQLTQNQFDALVSLVYDIGIKSLVSSGTMDLINTGEFIEASQKFRQWNRYKKTPIYQLIKSRKMEIELFNTPM